MSKMLKVAQGTNGVKPGTASFRGKLILFCTSWIMIAGVPVIIPLVKCIKISKIKNPRRTKNAGYRALNLKIFTIAHDTQIATMLLNNQCLNRYHEIIKIRDKKREMVALRLKLSPIQG